MKEQSKQLSRFLVVGLLAVATDAGGYTLLAAVISLNIAKGLSFIAGTVLAYALNNYWTFQYKGHNRQVFSRFLLLYGCSLIANVCVNQIGLGALSMTMSAAFLLATTVSATINFVGQKKWVFIKVKEPT